MRGMWQVDLVTTAKPAVAPIKCRAIVLGSLVRARCALDEHHAELLHLELEVVPSTCRCVLICTCL